MIHSKIFESNFCFIAHQHVSEQLDSKQIKKERIKEGFQGA